jgi:hypothetical protein
VQPDTAHSKYRDDTQKITKSTTINVRHSNEIHDFSVYLDFSSKSAKERMLAIIMNIELLTGKEAIELVR